MIFLRSIDFALRRAEFVELGEQSPCGDDDFARVVDTARSIGFRQVSIPGDRDRIWVGRDSSVNRFVSNGQRSTETVANVGQVRHQCKTETGTAVYDATFEHHEDSVYQLSCYAALVLATYGPFGSDLLKLRLAIHEICANVVEHGLQHENTGKISIHLEFMKDEIEGYIQDSCSPFDPLRARPKPLQGQIQNHEPRGYGIRIIQKLLSSAQYEFNETGNRITFRKKVDA